MNINANFIAYRETNSFTRLVLDYIDEAAELASFITAFPSPGSLGDQMSRKQFSQEKRVILHQVLSEQYAGAQQHESVQRNLDAILDGSTFTVCTAHQPNIFTGHLYFLYKIIHAIRLADECAKRFPDSKFVPVFYMGTEDNDLDEIGEFNYQGKEYRWTTSQRGACGRMDTGDLKPILSDVLSSLNTEFPDERFLSDVLSDAYRPGHTLAQATRILVNALFGRFGLLVLDADHPKLKRLFIPVMADELRHRSSERIVQETLTRFPAIYNVQAHPRAINLFYLEQNFRERIEYNDGRWSVLHSDLVMSETEILEELQQYPERFSPNVILRPLYQESILPNIAFVGGGGELAYWLELKDLFTHHDIPFPLIFLRNSVAWLDRKSAAVIRKLQRPLQDFFLERETLVHRLLDRHDSLQALEANLEIIQKAYDAIRADASAISPQLEKSVQAHKARSGRIHDRLRQKYMNQLKKRSGDLLQKTDRVQTCLFPYGKLQERHDNFLTLYKQYGMQMIDILMTHQQPLGSAFLILEEAGADA